MKLRSLLAGIASAGLVLLASSGARADYQITTGGFGAIAFGTNATLVGQGVTSSIQNGQAFVAVQDVEIAAPTTQTNAGTVPFMFSLTLTQTTGSGSSPAGSVTETASGSIQITRADSGGEVSFLVSLTASPITIGNTMYTFSNPSYSQPSVNAVAGGAGAGGLSFLVTPTVTVPAVPEPASVALMGVGIVGVLGVRRRKLARSL